MLKESARLDFIKTGNQDGKHHVLFEQQLSRNMETDAVYAIKPSGETNQFP